MLGLTLTGIAGLRRKLAEIDVDHITPMEALALLAALKKDL